MAGSVKGGKLSAQTNKTRYGKDYYKKVGKMGGKAHDARNSVKTIKEKYGDDFFSKIGKKGAIKRHQPKDFIERLYEAGAKVQEAHNRLFGRR